MAWYSWFWKQRPGPSARQVAREIESCGISPFDVIRRGDTVSAVFTFSVQDNVRRTALVYLDARGTALRLLRRAYKEARKESARLQERYNAGIEADRPADAPAAEAPPAPSGLAYDANGKRVDGPSNRGTPGG